MKCQKNRIAIFTSLILLSMNLHVVGLEDEMVSDKMRFSFEEEQKIWDKWFEENLKINPVELLYSTYHEEYYREVEERLENYYQDADFFLIYFEYSTNSGIMRTFLFVNNSNTWELIEWTEDRCTGQPLVVETKHELADFNKELARHAMYRHFYVGIKNHLLMDATSAYIYIFDRNKIGRFAFYGEHGVSPSNPAYEAVEQLLRRVDNWGFYF